METSARMLWPGWLGGLVSLAVGIGMWWPMILEAECRATANDLWIMLCFLGYVLATTLGIALLRQFFVLRKEARRQAAELPEPEPQVPVVCRDCKRGHLIPGSIPGFSAFGCRPAFGYLALVVSILLCTLLVPQFLAPYSSSHLSLDGRLGTSLIVFLFLFLLLLLLLGRIPTVRVSVLICDHCQRRSYPSPPKPKAHSEPEGAESASTLEE